MNNAKLLCNIEEVYEVHSCTLHSGILKYIESRHLIAALVMYLFKFTSPSSFKHSELTHRVHGGIEQAAGNVSHRRLYVDTWRTDAQRDEK